jgi:hypothetical protein
MEGVEHFLLNPFVALGIGLAVGGGIVIIVLARWGRKVLGIGDSDSTKVCPYAADHPKIQEFMGESTRDRVDLREFLGDMNGKMSGIGSSVSRMEGMLDILLRGARVRWNSGLIPPEEDRKK